MIKRTLYFGNPASLSLKNEQLVIIQDGIEKPKIPIEDIGYVILDHYQVSISHGALSTLLDNKASVITTDKNHLPTGMFLPLDSHTEQGERFRLQVEVSHVLKKQLWQQTVMAKLRNQADLLDYVGLPDSYIRNMVGKVRTDDCTNRESAASKYYWNTLFDSINFKRNRYGKPPNNLLNYGYAILRAVIARALLSSGLLPSLGIHHRNRYNAFPLADDIMEPYRPFVDEIVWRLLHEEYDTTTLTPSIKKELLQIPTVAVKINKENKPLMIAATWSSSSLQKCYAGLINKIIYPEICK